MASFPIKIFYDGTNIDKYGTNPHVVGFTTNTSFMVAGQELDYPAFYQKHAQTIGDRPISMQIFRDEDDQMLEDAMKVASYGDNVYVKVPIEKTGGRSNLGVIQKLLRDRIKVNVTAIFTVRQLLPLYRMLHEELTHQGVEAPGVVVSIFAGRISDTCVDAFDRIKFACTLFKELPTVEILWAGCKEVLSIQHAVDSGCHIITIPDSIMDRLNRAYKDLDQFSLETIQSFQKDALTAGIVL